MKQSVSNLPKLLLLKSTTSSPLHCNKILNKISKCCLSNSPIRLSLKSSVFKPGHCSNILLKAKKLSLLKASRSPIFKHKVKLSNRDIALPSSIKTSACKLLKLPFKCSILKLQHLDMLLKNTLALISSSSTKSLLVNNKLPISLSCGEVTAKKSYTVDKRLRELNMLINLHFIIVVRII